MELKTYTEAFAAHLVRNLINVLDYLHTNGALVERCTIRLRDFLLSCCLL